MSHYSGLKMTLSVQCKTRSYLQLLYMLESLGTSASPYPLYVHSAIVRNESEATFFTRLVTVVNSDSRTVSLLLLSEWLHNNNKYLSISFTAHLGGRQCAEELLSAL